MSNGAAYVLDETGGFPSRVNLDMVRIDDCTEADDQLILGLVHEHLERTGSLRARELIEQWEVFRPLFRKVVPNTTPTAPRTQSRPTIPEPAPAPGPAPTPGGAR
jgi:glutamate synthase domain-containing protein 3